MYEVWELLESQSSRNGSRPRRNLEGEMKEKELERLRSRLCLVMGRHISPEEFINAVINEGLRSIEKKLLIMEAKLN